MDIKRIRELISPTLESLQAELYEMSESQEGKMKYLHILVDRMDGKAVDLDYIVSVSEAISPILDQQDWMTENYVLDVASAGAERKIPIEKLENYVGKYVRLHLKNPFLGENEYMGTLMAVQEHQVDVEIQIKSRKKTISLAREEIDKAHLAIKF